MSIFCEDCAFWLFAYESLGERFGTCDHPWVDGKIVIDPRNEEDTVMHTEARFGCIYQERKHGNVVTKL